MTKTPSHSHSPLLKKLHKTTPESIYTTAAKVHITAGFEGCKTNTIVNAIWNEDKTALVVRFIDDSESTIMLEGARILTKCSCKLWQPARNCPHVVITWATLKRLVSPETLSSFKINQQMLKDMKRFMSKKQPPPDAEVSRVIQQNKILSDKSIKEEVENLKTAVLPFRMLLETDSSHNSITGRIVQGKNSVSGWTSIGIPIDLARFMAASYYYESTTRYFETFQTLTCGNYPIVFINRDGSETTLRYFKGETRNAITTFNIIGEELHISRAYDDGTVIQMSAILDGELLFDPKAGTIYTIANRTAWNIWQTLIDSINDKNSVEQSSITNEISIPLSLFNKAHIRLTSELFNNPNGNNKFLINGIESPIPPTYIPSYLINIPPEFESPEGCGEARFCVETLGICAEQTFTCSTSILLLLNPAHRADITSLNMRSKKKICALLNAVFELLESSDSSSRDRIIQEIHDSPDFFHAESRKEALQLLAKLTGEWDQKQTLLLATSEGWICAEEDLRTQARLMKILFKLFRFEAFCTFSTGELAIYPAPMANKLVLELTSELNLEGFSLQMHNEPFVAAVWEFSLDATKSGIDWFELKPEIRCNGEILTTSELSGLFNSAGLLRRNGKVMLMDETAMDVMSLLAGSLTNGKSKKSGKIRVPHLQILDWLQLRSQGVTVKLSSKDSKILESLLNFSAIPERILPVQLTASLRHYQIEAWRWLAFLYDHRFGACLADDMGLGKTLQAITLLAGIISGEITSAAAEKTPHLVVAPPSLLFNWEAEIARFLPSAKVYIYSGSGRTADLMEGCDIIITSYGIIQRDIEQIKTHRFDVIIFDETQVVKNLQSVTSSAVRKLKGAFVLGLTGTPVENNIGEYYAIMDLCLPGLLGTQEEFSRKFRQEGSSATNRLIARTRPFLLRRTKQLIASELPPKVEMDIQLELTTKQRALYQRTIEQVRGQINEAYSSHISAQAHIIALTAILRLRQICLAPALASADSDEGSPKLDFLAEQLEELREEGHSALVFSQFTGYLNIIENGLRDRGFKCLRLDGSTPVPQRKKLVESFQNSDEPTVFLISLKAGGRGLNLTKATYVYHMDPWWNPAVENQASDRAHRIGQTEQVTIIRLIMRHTIEEKMMTLKAKKTELYKAILEDGKSAGGAGLSREDFDFLLE